MTPVLAVGGLVSLLAILFLIVCVLMVLVILVQKPKGGGLSGAFGGGGGSAQAVLGAKTGEFLTYFTVGMFLLFILLAMGMQWTIRAEVEADPVPAVGSPDVPSTSTVPEEPAQVPDTTEAAEATDAAPPEAP
ncbi:MAG: preprotein translocase subunit SecG [Phycisphaeraceae bacterium]|nr:preprotein translocase subunit SecG [Phycisphaeraceae bacterium]